MQLEAARRMHAAFGMHVCIRPRKTRSGSRLASLGTSLTVAALAATAGCSDSSSAVGGLTGGANGNATVGGGAGGAAARGGVGAAGTGGFSEAGELGVGGRSIVVVEPSGAGGADEAGRAGEAGMVSVGPDDACALSSETVAALPSVLELVIDTSGSMDWPPGWAPLTPDDSKPPGATKWEITRDALAMAIDELDATVALGANFFPDTTEDDDESLCLRDEVGVPIATLGKASSSQRKSFATALSNVVPFGATPTEGAYRFGLEQLASTKLAGSQFLLLITDGTPTCTLDCECTEDNLPVDSTPLVADASQAFKDGVRTFVIGSPGSEDTRDVLSELARKGGTGKDGCSDAGPDYCHFDMTTEPDLATGLEQALAQVAASLRSCEYPIPAPPDGQTLDLDRVNVLYTPSDGKTRTVARDPSRSDCDDGWQYGDGDQSIVLCGTTCDAAKSDVGAKVEILIGCQTVSAEPR